MFVQTLAIAAATMSPVEAFVEAPGPNGPLKGTLLYPASDGAPVAIIIPGSGPTDRDGNSPAGLKASTYKLLAEGLAKHGVATLRIDKRGMFASAAAVPDGNAVTIADYAADIESWTGALRARSGVSCVWLIGHSEGGLVALAAVQQVPDICGVVLVAAPGRPLGQVMREQLRANPANAPLLDQAMAAIDALEAGKPVDTSGMHPALMPLFAPQVQNFVISLFSYDPAKLAAAYSGPMLIVQGSRDLQVSEEDARVLERAHVDARLLMVPEANHVLKTVSEDPATNAAAYADPSLPLAAGITDAIADFVNETGVQRTTVRP